MMQMMYKPLSIVTDGDLTQPAFNQLTYIVVYFSRSIVIFCVVSGSWHTAFFPTFFEIGVYQENMS